MQNNHKIIEIFEFNNTYYIKCSTDKIEIPIKIETFQYNNITLKCSPNNEIFNI